ncbi:MAG: HAD-IA family hydrolase [Oscillospiraceae bacterium]|nr:HAD-IA family hydrolase [Oscillospiraceae bacterium]
MTHKDILEYCLSKNGAYEDMPFGDGTVVVKVRKRIFAQLFYLNGAPMLTFNGDAMTGEFYRSVYPDDVKRGYHCPPVQQPYFNTVNLNGSVPDEEILRMLDGSYRYVVSKLAKRLQKELEIDTKSITHLIFDWGDTLMADDPNIKQAMYLWDKITVMQGVAEIMPYLHGKYVCTVGSNAGESDAIAMKKAFERVRLDGCFDYYFTSKELGARKPDTAFFDSIVRKLGTSAENAVMIGNDYAKDISGAKKAGLKTVLITAEKGAYPDADFVVKSFDEIKCIL